MQRINNEEILDIIPYKHGFLFVQKEDAPDGSTRASFFAFDHDGMCIQQATKKLYLQTKFGPAWQSIANTLGDFISCKAVTMSNGGVVALYDDGEMHIFNVHGKEIWDGSLIYHDHPVTDIAVDEKRLWGVVPEFNSIIDYSPIEERVMLRIGGEKSKAFDTPVGITKIVDKLYICNEGSNKIRTINLENYSVSDYIEFDEAVYKYYNIYDREYVVLKSGIYML
ncbi:MAG: hypothetical protein K5756_09105 [Clostridiales bacterium]|nr:hypothetical protein [Clostridiales bacterium]